MKKKKKKLVFIVVEHASRELESKKKIYKLFKKKDYTVFYGPRVIILFLIRVTNSTDFIFIDKGAQSYMNDIFHFIKLRGGYVIIMEEEGWIPYSWEEFLNRRLSEDTVSNIDEYWCSNEDQYAAVKDKYNKLNSKITGHPRFSEKKDIATYPITRLSELKGKDVLFTSHFAMLVDIETYRTNIMSEMGSKFDEFWFQNVIKDMQFKKDEFYNCLSFFCGLGINCSLRLHPLETIKDIPIKFQHMISDESEYNNISLNGITAVLHAGSTISVDLSNKNIIVLCLDVGKFQKAALKYSDYHICKNKENYKIGACKDKRSSLPFDLNIDERDNLPVAKIHILKLKTFIYLINMIPIFLLNILIDLFRKDYKKEHKKIIKFHNETGGKYVS